MKKMIVRLIKLVAGTALFALGIVMIMQANLGFAPWEVFHAGIGTVTGITIGNVSIITSLIICLAIVLMKEKLGLGTIINLFVIGVMQDLFLALNVIPRANGPVSGVALLVAGLFIIAIGSYFYLGAGLGPGPRDGLMVAMRRKTGFPVGLCRALIEGNAVWSGWVLGGPVGFGTILAALGIGFCIQIVFTILRFEVTAVHHETAFETFEHLKKLYRKTPSSSL